MPHKAAAWENLVFSKKVGNKNDFKNFQRFKNK